MRLLFAGGSGVPGGLGVRLVQPGALAPQLTFTRVQTGFTATAFAADGTTFATFLADVARFNGTARRALFEGQRTTGLRNPRIEGGANGVIGSGGILPTNMGVLLGVAGISVERIGVVVRDGVTCLRLRLSGTAGASGTVFIGLDTTTGVAALNGQVWTQSAFLALFASPGTVPVVTFRPITRNSGGTQLTAFAGTIETVGATFARSPSRVFTIADATTAFFQPTVTFAVTNGLTYDATFDIGWPQFEIGAFASTPILPPAGTPGAATRGMDSATFAFSTVFPAGIGTILGSCMIPQNAPAGADQMIFEINDNTANNRIRVRNVAGGATIVAGVVAGGTPTDATSLGSMTAGTLFRFGLTFDGSTITANLNGGTNQSITAANPAGLATGRLGNNAAGTAGLFGEIGYLDALPYVIPAAGLPAAVSAIP